MFLNRFITKHIGAPRHAALRAEATIICVEMREAYQLYRMGMKCDAKLVPCNCVCHNRPSNWCGKCRSVHDLKKKFDYRPVRAKVKELIKKIQAWTTTPQEQCFLYEIIMNELTMHKGKVFFCIIVKNDSNLSKFENINEKTRLFLLKNEDFFIFKFNRKP